MRTTSLTFTLALLLLGSPSQLLAQSVTSSPAVKEQGGDFYRFRVGKVTITALSDGTVPQDLHALLETTPPARTDDLLRARFLHNPVEASINAFLIELPDQLVLIDTGSGELFGPGNGGKLVSSLAAAGFRPEQITDILITHIHTDHSGGLVRGEARTFPNATVHVGQPDLDFFLDSANSAKSGYDMKYFSEAAMTLKPYIATGKVNGFAEATEVVPGIMATLRPGHTPGSAFYTLVNDGQEITFIGDIIHVAAVQFPDPSITIVYDVDPNAAEKTREKSFSTFAANRELVAAPHLPFPGIGHIHRMEKGYQWIPVEYGNRNISQ